MNSKGSQIGMPWDPASPAGAQNGVRHGARAGGKERGRVWHFGDSARSRRAAPVQRELLGFGSSDAGSPSPHSAPSSPRRPRATALPLSVERVRTDSEAPAVSAMSTDERRAGRALRERMSALAAAVPAHVRLGTVGYRYPQWGSLVFDGACAPSRIAERGLSEYTEQRLFRAIGLPSHDLVPDERELLWELLELPEGYTPAIMLNPGLTTPLFPRRKLLDAANGDPSDAGHFNPSFLDPRLFRDEVFPALEALRSVCDGELVVTLTVPPLLRESGVPPYPFLWRLERLATVVPDGIRVAVELREPDYVTDDYRAFLREADWNHVVSTWPGMPSLETQWRMGSSDGPRLVRLAAPRPKTPALGYAPGLSLHRPQPVVRAALQATIASDARETVILASNAFEGCAPLSLLALAEAFAEQAAGMDSAPRPVA